MPYTYPMMLDVANRLIVIVGAGAVAARKATTLIECGATQVKCVATRFDRNFPEGVQRIAERYESHHLDGARLAFAATDDPTVNAAVVRDARLRGVLVNRADGVSGEDAEEGGPSDFTTPARFHDGDSITVTVSAGNPALAAKIRNRIADQFDRNFSRMAMAMRTLRPRIVARCDISQDQRAQIFRKLASDEASIALSVHGLDGLWQWLIERHPELKDG
jgi:precorrin-2 dehydrogenase / sirohydrochlorin ferrochelatase